MSVRGNWRYDRVWKRFTTLYGPSTAPPPPNHAALSHLTSRDVSTPGLELWHFQILDLALFSPTCKISTTQTSRANEISEEQVEKRTRAHLMICSPVEYCLLATTARYNRDGSGRLQTP